MAACYGSAGLTPGASCSRPRGDGIRRKHRNDSDTDTSGGGEDDKLTSTAGGTVVFDRSKNGSGESTGAVTSTTPWTPPACWYAPKYTPAQLQKTMEPIWDAGATGGQWDSEQRNRYVNGKPYKDFNKDKTGKGYWWDSYVNETYPDGWEACKEPPFWVDQGDTPPADIENAITPEILAQLAYAEIRVPGTEVTLAPEGTTKVNLPTWAWLDGADFKPVSVTASVPVLGVEATTTAEAVSLKIEPGTEDAQTYPPPASVRSTTAGSASRTRRASPTRPRPAV